MAVSGNDIYVAGFEQNATLQVAKYWKNGNPVILSKGLGNAHAYSIAVSGNDVYVAGEEQDNTGRYVAKYWKNSISVIMSNPGVVAGATSIFLSKQ